MKIYLAMAAVGGWSLGQLVKEGAAVLISFHYDQQTLGTFRDEEDEDATQNE